MSTIDGADDKTRKAKPIFSGLLKYFPDACLAVAELSRIANEKHNPGEPLHWSRDKSNDHGDCIVRHQLDAGKMDTIMVKDGTTYKVRHSAEVAWRALAQLQVEIEAEAKPEAASKMVPWFERCLAHLHANVTEPSEVFIPAKDPRSGITDRRSLNDPDQSMRMRRLVRKGRRFSDVDWARTYSVLR